MVNSVLKLIVKATELEKRPKFDIFKGALFCTLKSSTTLVLNVVLIAARQYLWTGFSFFTNNWSSLEFLCILKELKTAKKILGESWTKYLWNFSRFR